MKKKPLPGVVGGYSSDGAFFKMTFKEFLEYSGGRLAVALFNGSFQSELYNVVSMAQARGIYNYLTQE